MCCLLLRDSPVICKMLPSCLSPASPLPVPVPARCPPLSPISLSQAGPSQPPARAAGPGGTCLSQTWDFRASPGGSWDPNVWIPAAAAGLGAVLCVPGISLILRVDWGLAQQSAHAALVSVCECVSVRLALKVTAAPCPGGASSQPHTEPSEAQQSFWKCEGVVFGHVLSPPSVLVKGLC